MRGQKHDGRHVRREQPREAPRLTTTHRRSTYAILGSAWLTGVLWLVTHYFFTQQGEFGAEPSALEPWWLRLHAAAAFLSLWIAGLVWAMHARHGISGTKRRRTGLLLIALFVALAISGYLLYYASGDATRDIVRLLHWTLGLAGVAPFLVHSLRARAARKHRELP